MEEIRLTRENRVITLQKALDVLRGGGLVVYPTETSYGLGCDFYNKKAIEKIYKVKEREAGKPLSVIVPDFVYATSLVDFSDAARRLAMENWPGPLTLVLPFKYSDWQGHSDKYLALRVSNHPLAGDLSINFGNPIVATSANISQKGDSYDPYFIVDQFKQQKLKPDLLINVGELPKKLPSTIIKVDGDDVEILRQGGLEIKI
ncbi:threonylcarbamoyl-AMP synthase [Candidatus Parcubacteria bacterium]|jgi:L-threonylcarbamoyladenylate synthase|nr:threonylcarbamoyl-AMP synthase [Candidatus Parcubacteria bacterium]MBT7227953.1 threonylcarbamoyl-AMP synthase [Candidatus Parcubacteria bacterium]